MVKSKSYGGHALRIVVGITMLVLLLAGGGGAVTPISSCTTISLPGEFVLDQSILNSGASSCIYITSSDVIFDGAGYTIDGIDAANSYGVYVYNSTTVLSNVTVKNLKVTDWAEGIFYSNTQNGSIANNTANSNNWNGILLAYSSNNTLNGNNASINWNGIRLAYSSDNTLSGNNASNNQVGIILAYSSNNKIYHNNLINNLTQAFEEITSNAWDSGYPYGGNYWSDYTGIDENGDGIGDTPYPIISDAGSVDRYPLMEPWRPVHNINKGTGYFTIQSAIDDAITGDEIHVDSGTYYENVNVNKQLILRGIGMPVVDARGSGSAITLSANGITLEGFTATGSSSIGYAGIDVNWNSNSNTISGNTASNNYNGIHLYISSNNTLSGNNVSNNGYSGIDLYYSGNNSLSGNNNSNNRHGIHLYISSNNNTLRDNNATNNYDGVYLFQSSNNDLTDNTANSNTQRGIFLDYSSNNTLSGNNASNNIESIHLYNSSNNTISSNNAANNEYVGFYLEYSSNNNTIRGNNISNNNNYGIYLFSSSNNTIVDNHDNSNNGPGISLESSSNNNILYENNIYSSVVDNSTNNKWDNSRDIGNHYSNYDEPAEDCIDSAPKDGVCDSAYTIPGTSSSKDNYPLTTSGEPVSSSTGNGITYFDSGTGTIEDLGAVNVNDIPEPPPTDANLYYGLFKFNITNVPNGGSAILTLTFPDNLPDGIAYLKYGATISNPTPHWYTIPSTINGNKLTITLTDGGLGDDDLTANGRIKDDGGPSIPEWMGTAVPISECTTISSSGEYVLNQSILNSGALSCINITSSDVIFDGAGYTIDGIDAANSYGVYIYNSILVLTNVTVKNLTVTDWYDGIYYKNTQNVSIANNTANSNNARGIALDSSSNNTLNDNIVSNNFVGIQLITSNYSTLKNNIVTVTPCGGMGIGMENSHYNTLIGNTANQNDGTGIIFGGSSSNNNLADNNVSLNGDMGIWLTGSNNNNTFSGNILTGNGFGACGSGKTGIAIGTSSNNILADNIVINNMRGLGLWNSIDNNIYDNIFNNSNNYFVDSTNIWNITKSPGTNIIGGPNLGGNIWAKPDGTGFSQTCVDTNKDGICDLNYSLATGNVDDLPLAFTPSGYGYISGNVLNGTGIADATVSTNSSANTTTDASGFYSMLVPAGTFNLTATSEPRFYTNNSITITVVAGTTVIQDIELLKKQTGNIMGNVSAK